MSRTMPMVFLGGALALAAGPDQPGKDIDTERSSVVIHVGKAGLLSAAGHEHWVNAPIKTGSVDDSGATPGVRFTVDSRKLSVKAEKGVSDKDQAGIQSTMQGKVLESSLYPEIAFHSTQVLRSGDRRWKVSGELILHGRSRPVVVDVVRENGAYLGTVSIKQTDFGIQPIKSGGGVVRVKDELEITFKVYTMVKP